MSSELLCFPFLWTEYVQQHRQLINKTLHITLYLGLHTWPAYVPWDIQPALQPVGRGMPMAGFRDGCKAEWRGARRRFLPAISRCPAEISNIEGTAGMEQQKILLCTQLATYLSLQVTQPQQSPIVQRLRQEASNVKCKLDNLVN